MLLRNCGIRSISSLQTRLYLREKIKYRPYLRYFSVDLVKFGTGYIQKRLLHDNESRENQRVESHTLLKVVNKFPQFPHLLLDLAESSVQCICT
jgi:hypothetical protein